MQTSHPLVTRRHFLLATGSLLVVGTGLSACGDDDDTADDGSPVDTTGDSSTGDTSTIDAPFGVVQRFPNINLFTPGEVRLPISLTDGQELLTGGPDQLTGWIETQTGERVADVNAPRRDDGVDIPYWEVRATLEQALVYTLRLEGDDGFGASFELWEEVEVPTPSLGTEMPPFDTPTVDDHRGVEPYCSLTPEPCPLHDVTLAQALESGKPVAYMVGTPAFCQTGTCAPGLEFLVEEHERVGDRVVMVHADVYADDAGTTIAPAVEALGAQYEPIIYLCDASGVVVDRLDGVWDRSELRERLDLLLS